MDTLDLDIYLDRTSFRESAHLSGLFFGTTCAMRVNS